MKEIFHTNTPIATRLNIIFLMGVFFFIPIQAAPANILGILAIIAYLFSDLKPSYQLTKNLKDPLTLAIVGFFLIHLLSLAWTTELETGTDIVQQYLVFLLFPFFVSMMKREYTPYLISAFLAGMLISEIASYGLWLDLWQTSNGNNDHTFFIMHIQYAPIAAFAAYLLAVHLINHWNNHATLKRIIYLFFIFTLSLNIFFTHGRAGMVAIIVLFLTLAIIKLYRKPALLVTVPIVILTMVMTAYQLLPDFQKRVDAGLDNIQQLVENNLGVGSINQRIAWSIQGFELFTENPLMGVGVGDFKIEQVKINETSALKTVPTWNPHNQYIFTLATVGLAGFLFLLAIFVFMIRKTYSHRDEYTLIRIGLIVMYPVIFLAESYLLKANTGLLFVMFTAMLFSKDLIKSSR